MNSTANAACYIQRIGTAVPEPFLDQTGSGELLQHGCVSARAAKLLQRVAKLTGIRKRHLAALNHQSRDPNDDAMYRPATVQPQGPGMLARTRVFEQESGPLVLRALRAIEPAELEQIGTLITVSCTHASSPGLERPIFTNTPVPRGVHRWNLGFMGCSAGLAGLRLAKEAEATARDSLVVACELSSLHFQYTDQLDQMTANVLFADGAAAVQLTARPGPARVLAARSIAVPAFAEQMVWYAGDHGLALTLSQDLPETLAAHLPGAIDTFLRENGHSRSDIRHWLVHPGGPQILDAVESCLSLRGDALADSRAVFTEYGNMSSPTIFFILKRVLDAGAQGLAVAMAFGPGLTVELVLLQLS